MSISADSPLALEAAGEPHSRCHNEADKCSMLSIMQIGLRYSLSSIADTLVYGCDVTRGRPMSVQGDNPLDPVYTGITSKGTPPSFFPLPRVLPLHGRSTSPVPTTLSRETITRRVSWDECVRAS